MIKTRYIFFCIFFIFGISFFLHSLQNSESDNTFQEDFFWYGLIDLQEEEVLSKLTPIFGNTPIEISPKDLKSKADRIVWLKDGPTLWFSSKRLVQLRLTSNIKGSYKDIFMGCSTKHVINILGNPWIKKEDNLYYNLPWRGGPVRLRLVFVNNKLTEAYIYNLNFTTNNN